MTLSVRRVAPLLSVRTGAATVEFYKQAFGVEERFRIDDGEGAVVATLGVGDLEFWVADESPQNANFSPETVGGSTVRLILYAPGRSGRYPTSTVGAKAELKTRSAIIGRFQGRPRCS